jgi:hypothetical protein
MKKQNSDSFINAINETIKKVGCTPSAPAPEPDTTGFVEPLISSHETFSLIERMAAHLKKLICNETDIKAGDRIFTLLNEIQRLAADGQEEISYTGLSWE